MTLESCQGNSVVPSWRTILQWVQNASFEEEASFMAPKDEHAAAFDNSGTHGSVVNRCEDWKADFAASSSSFIATAS